MLGCGTAEMVGGPMGSDARVRWVDSLLGILILLVVIGLFLL